MDSRSSPSGLAVALIGVLFVLAGVVFLLQQLTPADPVHAMLGANASQATIDAKKHELGYDRPLAAQYLSYIGGLPHGDLQMSLRTRRPVMTDLADYLPATARARVLRGDVAVVLGGIARAWRPRPRVRARGSLRDRARRARVRAVFLLALLGILLFYRRLGWLPATGRIGVTDVAKGRPASSRSTACLHGRPDVSVDALKHLVLPAFCVAIGPAVAIGRVLRSSLVDDAAVRLRAHGAGQGPAGERRSSGATRLRNSVGPALSMTGLQIGLMFAGVVVIESIFAWPGIGFYTVQSIPRTDFPAIAGVTLVLGVGYVMVNTLVEICPGHGRPPLSSPDPVAPGAPVQ